MTYPSVYPTGATIYNPEKCWNGYTIFQAKERGALLIDMNGAEVKLWKGLHGFPNKLLPGGYVLGHSGERNNAYGMQDMIDLVQVKTLITCIVQLIRPKGIHGVDVHPVSHTASGRPHVRITA